MKCVLWAHAAAVPTAGPDKALGVSALVCPSRGLRPRARAYRLATFAGGTQHRVLWLLMTSVHQNEFLQVGCTSHLDLEPSTTVMVS